jgi:hypothetical protein
VLRTRLAKAYIKRTIRPLYGPTQATPKSCFLDAAWGRTVQIWPGMVFTKTLGENVTLIGSASGTAATQRPMGLGALYVGGDEIDEVLDSGINAFAVWVLGPDAEFEVLAPAFDTSVTWTDLGDGIGSTDLVYAWVAGPSQGKLCPAGATSAGNTIGTVPVARLLKVNSASKITIGGLGGTI